MNKRGLTLLAVAEDMGGTQSTEAAAAATNDHATNGSSRRDVYANLERRDSEDDDCECSLFSCNPGKGGTKTKKKKTASDLLGTPLLTPKLGDRRKQRGAQDAKAQQPTLFMSRYGGLEKEPSADAGDATAGSWERAPSAVVHEGSVSTTKSTAYCCISLICLNCDFAFVHLCKVL